MEGKTKRLSAAAAAAWCLLAVLLLSSQMQPAAAMSRFCRCYKKCYADCRKVSGPYPCNFGCLQDCFNNDDDQLMPRPARPKSAADCDRICLIRVCGVMSTASAAMAVVAGGDDAQTCLVDCRNSIGHSAPVLIEARQLMMN
ncbi:hypothetical protein SORBI_3004G014500 [Sorghum bicolor]|nr:hypothetical protein SORBI_3004G014500 [Sorghum bicolor]